MAKEIPFEQRCYRLQGTGPLLNLPDGLLRHEETLAAGEPLRLKAPLELVLSGPAGDSKPSSNVELADMVRLFSEKRDFPEPLIVSKRLAALFTKHGRDGVELTLVRWVSAKGKPVGENYVLVTPPKVDVIDTRASKKIQLWQRYIHTAALDAKKVRKAPQLFRFAQAELPAFGIRYELAKAIHDSDCEVSWEKCGPRDTKAEEREEREQAKQAAKAAKVIRRAKTPLAVAIAAGTAAGEAAVLDGKPTARELADMADDAWEHDGIPWQEDRFPRRSHGPAEADAYTKAFIEAIRNRT